MNRSVWRRAALPLVVALSLLGVIPAARAAATPTWSPVIQGEAGTAWGFLEGEALGLLSARSFGQDFSQQYLRDQVRAYVFARLLDIIRKPAADRSPAEQGAYVELEKLVLQERNWSAVNALAKFHSYKVQQLNCPSFSGPTFPGTGLACAFSEMFGHTPVASSFTAAGYAETFQALHDPAAARVVYATTEQIAFWQGFELPEGATESEAFQVGELKDVLKEKMGEAVREILIEVTEGLIEGSLETGSWAILAVSAAVVLGYGIWNAIDVGDTEAALTKRVTDTANATSVDLTEVAGSPAGFSELLFTVLEQSFPSDGLVYVDGPPCSFDSTYTCQRYHFAADADYVSDRYTAGPPAHTSGDPLFLVRKQGATTGSILPTVEPVPDPNHAICTTLGSDNIRKQVAAGADVGQENFDLTSVRSTFISAPQDIVGLSAYLSNNLFVVRNGGCGSPYDATWLYQPGLKYVNWQGEWWTAWFQGDTFLHTKSAEPIAGTVVPGDKMFDYGLDGCIENPAIHALFASLSQVEGPDCLFSKDGANFSNLHHGDQVLVDGSIRVVDQVTDCIRVIDTILFGVYKDDQGCQDYGKKAVILEHGATESWEAFNWFDTLYHFLDFPSFPSWGAPDSQAMKFVALNSCTGRAGCTTPTDLANCSLAPASGGHPDCYFSPSIQYKRTYPAENWSATLVTPVAVTGLAIRAAEGASFHGNVATFTDPAGAQSVSDYAVAIDWGDGSAVDTTTPAVTLSDDTFNVAAEHTYGEEGSYTVTISVTRAGTTSTATATATVSDPAVVATGVAVTATEGAAFSGAVATFTDPGKAEPNASDPSGTIADHYKVTSIDWGDGTALDTTSGAISLKSGTFTATGGHTYAEEGSYIVTVVIDHEGITTSVTANATVSDPAVVGSGSDISATEGAAFSGAVATFTDPGKAEPNASDPSGTIADHYKVTSIDWGDGTALDTTSGAISLKSGTFTATGGHTYAEEGRYTVVALVDHEGVKTTFTGNAIVADAPLTATCAAPSVANQGFSGTTTTFTDADPNGVASDYAASIDWGDGTTSSGAIAGGPTFTVSADHTYGTTGYFTVTTTIADHGSTASSSCRTLVYGFAPGGGSFVIGNGNSANGTAVTFWGQQWSKLNTVSGGQAPATFKGYALNPSTPAIGSEWSTDPGNSSPPPAGPLPAYMEVIVTSSVSQSGSVIRGDTPHLVVVAVASGYQANPGHPGTGTVVAQIQ